MGAILILFGIALYFVPSIVAYSRDGKHAAGILLLNVFLGWLVVPWLGLIVWAMYDVKLPPQPVE